MSDPSAVPPPPPAGGFAPPPPAAGFSPPPPMAGGVPGGGLALSSPGKRLGGALLDGLLFIVTLGIGWLIWWVVAWGKAQTPAKQILKMRTVKLDEQRPLTFGEMAMRELVGRWVLAFVPFYTVVSCIILLIDDNNQAIWDKLVASTVVDDPNNQFGL